MAITFRGLKGTALSHPEMDTNLASYYLSSSVSGSTINFYQSGSDGNVITTSHTLTDLTGSDTTYTAGEGLSLSSENIFSLTEPHFSGDYNDLINTPDVSLSLVTNDLTLTKLDGTTDVVDLTPYLDEDARAIASGTLNGVTGIVTFTRDDATTFTLDLSDLLDDTNLVTSVNGANGVVELNLQDVCDVSSNTSTTITAANFITTSDKRLKSDIKPIQEGLETIKKFVSYEYVKDGIQDAGFLAQEVQEAIPYSIGEREDGFLTMRDRPVLAHMHKAILELEARLAAIEEKLG